MAASLRSLRLFSAFIALHAFFQTRMAAWAAANSHMESGLSSTDPYKFLTYLPPPHWPNVYRRECKPSGQVDTDMGWGIGGSEVSFNTRVLLHRA